MKKSLLFLLCILLTLFAYGCGSSHKSDAELVDVEQFKCQESIQTVFEVLGETDVAENLAIGVHYQYEDINLWGYNGQVTFSVRDDKDTIVDFDCELTLNDEEFEDVLSQFLEEYGSYEMRDDGDDYKSYTWTISEKDGKIGYEEDELGYDKITIEYYGNNIYRVNFHDEWSIINDEVYFEKVEEAQKTDSDTLALVEADVCGDSLVLFLEQKENEYELYCMGTAQDKEHANILLGLLWTTCDDIKESYSGYSLAVTYDNSKTCMIIWDGNTYNVMGINENGSQIYDLPDWFTGEILISDSEFEEYTEAYQAAWLKLAEEIAKL